MKELPSSTFCRLPFSHLYIDTLGDIYPCCMSVTEESQFRDESGNKIKGNDPDLFEKLKNSPELKNIRSEFLSGLRPECCQSCFKFEDSLTDSYRTIVNKDFENIDFNNIVSNPQLWSIDLRLGNKCNLKCQMCLPQNSFLIESEFQKIFDIKNSNLDKKDFLWANDFEVFENIIKNLNSECRISFAGGEPLISSEGFKFISKLVERGISSNIILHYNTNLNTFPFKFVPIWREFKEVLFVVSIDATEDLAEYIRYPIKWNNFNTNLKKLVILSHVNKKFSIGFHTVVQVFNIFDLDNLINFTAPLIIHNYSHRLDFVMGAENCFSIRDLPDDLKKIANDKLNKFLVSEQFARHKDFENMKKNLELVQLELSKPAEGNFKKSMIKTVLFDQSRGHDFFKLRPVFLPYRPKSHTLFLHKYFELRLKKYLFSLSILLRKLIKKI